MTKFLHSKRILCSIYSKSLSFYGKKSKDLTLERQAVAEVCRIHVLEDFANFTGKQVYQILYLMKFQASTLLLYCKRDLGADVFL